MNTDKQYFLGVDIGWTKSHALLADEQGRCVAFGSAGCGSWEALGWDGARQVLHDITGQILAQASLNPEDITGAGFGYAGYDWPEDRPGHVAMIESLGMKNAHYILGNDSLVGLVAGAEKGWGIVVLAGTSNNCRGRDKDGREGRITGNGSLYGEYGGAAELVHKAVTAVAAAWTLRGPATTLTGAFIDHTGASDIVDLLAGLIRERYHIHADAAPLVFAEANKGDAVAQEIIAWAGQSLGELANAVIRQLDLASESFDVVLSGSLYKGGPLLIEPMRRTIHAYAPGANLVRLAAAPVVGGVLLGMEAAGRPTAEIRPALLASARQFMSEARA